MEWMNEQKKKHLLKITLKNIKCFYIYNQKSGNVGSFFYIWIKWILKDFQITWANILFTTEHREHKCLHREILHFYPLNELISNLMPATSCNKKVGMGATKGWKSKQIWKDSAERTAGN